MLTDNKKQILVIEDDRDIRESIVELLEYEQFDVISAVNGQEGLALLRSGAKPNLILLDLMMPVMDGFQFRKEQSNSPEFSNIPVIIMTADGHVEAKKDLVGAVNFIRKPLSIDSALEVINQALA